MADIAADNSHLELPVNSVESADPHLAAIGLIASCPEIDLAGKVRVIQAIHRDLGFDCPDDAVAFAIQVISPGVRS